MRKIISISALISFVLLFAFCSHQQKKEVEQSPWLNLNDTVKYVGMKACAQCHVSKHESFIQTGMGKSWDVASRQKSSAKFDAHAIVYDKFKDFYYKPFWKNDSLYIMEFRLKGKDTIYKRIEQINYIVGSGHHTNSHIWKENGFLFQAPITFYTQKGIWDMAPGFEGGENSRWNRIISLECMSCHNMYPDFNFASENKFFSVQQGIECERCHGPGSLHVKEKLLGHFVDTAKYADYTIVNPKRLPLDLQVELCQRCHMQGISVLNEGKTFFDFRPGMKLNEVMNVFMPRYKGGDEKFIMASHADRMKQSRCFIQSKKMTCLTCHNPHVSVAFTPANSFNQTCKNCHAEPSHTCKATMIERKKKDDNCFICHMPVSETIDIPNVTVHDHRIQIPVSKKEKDDIQQFIGLECMTTQNPDALLMAQGYLTMYESFISKSFLLDSAFNYLQKVERNSSSQVKKEFIRYYFLKKDFSNEIQWVKKLTAKDSLDAWTNYRAGDGFFNTGDTKTAQKYFQSAVNQKSDMPDFQNKLASSMLYNNQLETSKALFEKILNKNSKYVPALSNLAYLYLLKGDAEYSSVLIEKALALDPDYVEALMNKLALLIGQQKKKEALIVVKRVLELDPKNDKAKQVLTQLNSTL